MESLTALVEKAERVMRGVEEFRWTACALAEAVLRGDRDAECMAVRVLQQEKEIGK